MFAPPAEAAFSAAPLPLVPPFGPPPVPPVPVVPVCPNIAAGKDKQPAAIIPNVIPRSIFIVQFPLTESRLATASASYYPRSLFS